MEAEIWVTAARDAAGALVVAVGDNGVGLPETVDLHTTTSMGWQLVQSFVAQLHGQYTLQRQPGTLFTLVVPPGKPEHA
jgi:two-component sensor histidine kinase